jgi:hypothetical protein
MIAGDSNWSYHRLINFNHRKIVKIKKTKKENFLEIVKVN